MLRVGAETDFDGSDELIDDDGSTPSRCAQQQQVVANTIDRWPGWSLPNIPAIASIVACFKHFALASLRLKHRPTGTLPKPLKISFPFHHDDADSHLSPSERLRLGSAGLHALLLQRLSRQPSTQPAPHPIIHDVRDRLCTSVASRVCSWQPPSEIETAFLHAIQTDGLHSEAYARSDWSRFYAKDFDSTPNSFIEQMSDSDRSRLLTARTCRQILTRWSFDAVNDAWLQYDLLPPTVVRQLAHGFMRNLFENLMDQGEMYSWHEDLPDVWRSGIDLIASTCPLALSMFMRCSFARTLFVVVLNHLNSMCRRDECSAFDSSFYEFQSSTFLELCSMLADVADIDHTSLQPCAPQLLHILQPHWAGLSVSSRQFRRGCAGFDALRSKLEALSEPSCSSTSSSSSNLLLMPFPVSKSWRTYCSKLVRQI